MNNEEQKYTALEHAEGKLTKKTDKLVTKIVRTDDPQEL